MTTRVPRRTVNRGSSNASVRAVKVTSACTPASFGPTTTRRRRMGSGTCTSIGPTWVRTRPGSRRPEAWTDVCTPSLTTLNEASITCRFG
jgi:hypothetical protein